MKSLRYCAALLLAAGISSAAWAVPARQGLRTFTQPDGTKIRLMLSGDEYSHKLIDQEGRVVARGDDGFYRPLTDAQKAERYAKSVVRRGKRNLPLRRSAQENPSQVPHIGSPRVPILLVQYSDYKFKDADPKATFEKFFATGDVSAHQYFYDQSNGKFDAKFDVYGPVTLSGKRVDYGGNDWFGYDEAVGKMVAEGCLGLDKDVDFSKYDNDGDGECDVVIILYAGDGEASSYEDDCEDAVWPCQWDLEGSDYGKSLKLDNTKVNLFAVFNELYGMDLTKIDGIGTFCHEFSHCLGLPDFYDTEYKGHFGMGPWSLMDYGSYNDDGYTPIGYSAYEKEFMGWLNIPEAEANTAYTLTPMNLKNEATDMAVKLTNDADPDEYYILENRKQQGWDKFLPAEGLLITHFTYDAGVWEGNTVNDYDLQRATIIPADNSLKMNKSSYGGQTYYEIDEADLKGDLWPYKNATELTDNSVPAAKVNKGGYMSKPITEITKNADGTISFMAMKGKLPAVETPHHLSHNVLSNTSVEISWQSSDENVGSFNLEVRPHVENPFKLLYEASFANDPGDWTKSGYSAFEDGGIRLGSSKQLASMTSPSLKVDDAYEAVTVTFTGKSWTNDNASVRVSLIDSKGVAVDQQDVALTYSYADYSVTFSATPGMDFKVQFETIAMKKRFYISAVAIYSGEYDANSAKLRAPAGETQIFKGITGTSYVVEGLSGGSYDYRVHAVAADSESYNDSPWSSYATFEVPGDISGVTLLPGSAGGEVWYTLQGLRLLQKPLAPGVYIRKRAEKTEKVIVK